MSTHVDSGVQGRKQDARRGRRTIKRSDSGQARRDPGNSRNDRNYEVNAIPCKDRVESLGHVLV